LAALGQIVDGLSPTLCSRSHFSEADGQQINLLAGCGE